MITITQFHYTQSNVSIKQFSISLKRYNGTDVTLEFLTILPSDVQPRSFEIASIKNTSNGLIIYILLKIIKIMYKFQQSNIVWRLPKAPAWAQSYYEVCSQQVSYNKGTRIDLYSADFYVLCGCTQKILEKVSVYCDATFLKNWTLLQEITQITNKCNIFLSHLIFFFVSSSSK